MDWVEVGSKIAQVAAALNSYLQNKESEAARERDRKAIIAAIEQTRKAILEANLENRLRELTGEIEGLHTRYDTYDPQPDDTVEEGRLVSVIDGAATLLGNLGVEFIDELGSDAPAVGVDAWAPYAALAFFRAQAMTEREVTFGANEVKDVADMLDVAIVRTESVLTFLRGESDRRFSRTKCGRHPDFQETVCSYKFQNEEVICGRLSDPTGVRKCNDKRAAHMDREFAAFVPVPQVRSGLNDLVAARDQF
jgi:hypothetical protein